jgi:antitoxin VapB
MALNIKDPEADRLARELAALTGTSITAALREALEEKVARTRARKHAAAEPGLDDIITRGRGRPLLDQRPDDEILGYDEHGLPA